MRLLIVMKNESHNSVIEYLQICVCVCGLVCIKYEIFIMVFIRDRRATAYIRHTFHTINRA